MPSPVLLLGGTTEAGLLARRLADAGIPAIYSYAGRTETPVQQPLPTRVGGFGGVGGLTDYLRQNTISAVVDATHPFASQMSRNAIAACAALDLPLIALERPPWQAVQGDRWTQVRDLAAAVVALPAAPARIFLAIGRQGLEGFSSRPDLYYLLRLVDPPDGLPLPDAHAVILRGPFTLADDIGLMKTYRITHVVAKNAGGEGARAKLDAARALGLPVIMIARPQAPPRTLVGSVDAVMEWLAHADLGVKT